MNMKMVTPDEKGRVTLGHIADGVSRFAVINDPKNNRIILEPYIEVPASEKWLLENRKALHSVKKGLEDASKGKVTDLGSFSKYINEDIE